MVAKHREIDVKKQRSLSLGRSLRFCMKGISHRLFRSMLTLAVVVLAVAFFMSLLTESAVVKAVGKGVSKEIEVQREATIKLNFFVSPPLPSMSSKMLADASSSDERLNELAKVSGITTERLKPLASQAKIEQTYLSFFESMGVGQRSILIKKSKGRETFTFLAEPSNWRNFAESLEPLRSLKLPTKLEDFKVFVDSYPKFDKDIQEFTAKMGKKIGSVSKTWRQMMLASSFETLLCCVSLEELMAMAKGNDEKDLKWRLRILQGALKEVMACEGVDIKPEGYESCQGKSKELFRLVPNPGEAGMRQLLSQIRLDDWICFASEMEFMAWGEALREAGFSADRQLLDRMRQSLRDAKLRSDIAELLATKEKRDEWKKMFLDNPTLEAKMLRLGTNAKELVKMADGMYSITDFKKVGHMVREEATLSSLEKELSVRVDNKNRGMLSGRQIFLLLISFVVCMVGIANAMLMSITERFREIATMKCLGATDGFILTQFLLEAGIQGACGGVAGTFIGFALATVKDFSIFGTYVFMYFPAYGVIACAGISLVVGMALAMLASIYPSWSASRMAPMEAMRVE